MRKPRWRSIGLAAVVVLLLALVVPGTVGSSKALAQGVSTATISPTQGTPGTKITGSGSNWRTGDHIQAIWDGPTGTYVGNQAVVNTNGSLSLTFSVPPGAPRGSHVVTFWDIDSRYFVNATVPFTVTYITVGGAFTAQNGQVKTSFIPGEVVWYTVIVGNSGSGPMSVKFTWQGTGPQGRVFYDTNTVNVNPGTWSMYSPGTLPNLAPFGSYTNTDTVVADGLSYVKQSTFTVGDHRLQGALNWMAANSGKTTVKDPSGNTFTVNNNCEKVAEDAYGVTGIYGSALVDYQAQLAAGRIHSESDPYHSTAPAGALVFFTGSDPTTGHIGIAVGNGHGYWTTDGTIHVAPLTEGVGYKGWSLAPLNWKGLS
jgi:hypothetical protein